MKKNVSSFKPLCCFSLVCFAFLFLFLHFFLFLARFRPLRCCAFSLKMFFASSLACNAWTLLSGGTRGQEKNKQTEPKREGRRTLNWTEQQGDDEIRKEVERTMCSRAERKTRKRTRNKKQKKNNTLLYPGFFSSFETLESTNAAVFPETSLLLCCPLFPLLRMFVCGTSSSTLLFLSTLLPSAKTQVIKTRKTKNVDRRRQ